MKKGKMSERLTELQMFDLVKIYKKHYCLWDIANQDYKNREVRNNAYKEILKNINISGLTEKDLKQKIKNLRTSYYAELRKIEASAKEGGKYKPKVAWFPIAHDMLNGVSRNQIVIEIESEPESNVTKTKKDNTRKTIATLDKIANKVTPQATNTQRNEQQTTNTKRNEPQTKYEDDEYETYGKYIALSLRSMPTEMSIITRTKLQKTLAKIQLLALQQRKPGTKPVHQCGPSTSKIEEDPLKDPPDNFTIEMDLTDVKTEEED